MTTTCIALAIIAAGTSTMPVAPGSGANLIQNPAFTSSAADSRIPLGYELKGNATWTWTGYRDETEIPGVALSSFGSNAKGSVSQTVLGLSVNNGHWIRFSFRGRAEDGFSVANDRLYMKIDFLSKQGQNDVDSAERLIYREILNDRKFFAINGDNHKSGAAVWRTYAFEELLPFPQIDSVRLTLGFDGGNAQKADYSRFFATDFSLVQLKNSSEGKQEPVAHSQVINAPASTAGLIHLGGRWFYRALPGEELRVDSKGRLEEALTVTEANADRLFYKDDRLVNPFLGNMTAWLRKGYKDLQGEVVTKDRFVPDNLTINFDSSDYWTIHARNLPNHQTAKFPDTIGTQGYNPSYIQEHRYTYRLPLNPVPNARAIAMTANDSNGALNMGTVGFAVNGVAFYNPFDAGMQDATGIMDRCCGHPSPDNRYHYHKYPICVNTPFVDKGAEHSPIIGFALDGLPIYGPYEEKDTLARDDTKNPLNAFNAHYDPIRGWHYHVTPGKFPYIIGGYFAADMHSDRGASMPKKSQSRSVK